MKTKFLVMLFSCFMLIVSGCDSPCSASSVHVGGAAGRAIVLIDQSGDSPDTIATVDGNGNVNVPCGMAVGGGQTR
jgi:hypothetical protein